MGTAFLVVSVLTENTGPDSRDLEEKENQGILLAQRAPMRELMLGRGVLIAVAIVASLGVPAETIAAPITVTVKGRATSVGPDLGALGFAVGDELTLVYAFDDALVSDSAPAPDFGHFRLPTGSMTVALSGYTASVADIGIAIDATFDYFSFGSFGYPMSSDLPAGYQVQGLSFFAQDPSAQASRPMPSCPHRCSIGPILALVS